MSRLRQTGKTNLSGTRDAKREPLVSVIIPIYNVESYLDKCLESICGQTLRDIEIICINDGSTDRSEEIMNEWAEKDCRIVAHTFENGGLSASRNRGFTLAKGKYIYYIDSDDALTIDSALEELYDASERNETDVVLFGAVTEFEDESCRMVFPNFRNYYIRRGRYEFAMSGTELFCALKNNGECFSSVPCLFLKRSFLIDSQISFYEGITHEDELFTFIVLMKAKRAMCIKKEYYLRLVRKGSIMTRKNLISSVRGKLIGGGWRCIKRSIQYGYQLSYRVQ